MVVSSVAVLAVLTVGCGGTSEGAAPSAPPDFFGLIDRLSDPDDYSRISRIGVRTFRFPISWSAVQTTRNGAYDWSRQDAFFAQLALNGIKPIPFLVGTPAWLAPTVGHPPIRNAGQQRLWRKFVAAAVERYGRGGEFWTTFQLLNLGVSPQPPQKWQIWNEPNIELWWRPRPRAAEYAKLLRISAAEVHAADPRARIISAGLLGAPKRSVGISSWVYLKQLYRKRGMKREIDLVGLHPYSPGIRGIGVQMRRLRRTMAAAGQRSTRTIVGELGWGSDPKVRSKLAKSRAGQARLLSRAFNLFLNNRRRWRVRHVMWFRYRDATRREEPDGCRFCYSAGLRDVRDRAKPSWNRFLQYVD